MLERAADASSVGERSILRRFETLAFGGVGVSSIAVAELQHGAQKSQRQGTPIGSLDTSIAAQALSLDVTLVAKSEREFARVPELKVENWVRGK